MKTESAQPGLFKPRRVAVRISYDSINEFNYFWILHNRPCDYRVQRSTENPQLLGICFNVENNDTIDMLESIRKRLHVQIYDL